MLQFIKTINVLKWCVKHTRFVMGQQHFVKTKFTFEYNLQETCPIDQPGTKIGISYPIDDLPIQ